MIDLRSFRTPPPSPLHPSNWAWRNILSCVSPVHCIAVRGCIGIASQPASRLSTPEQPRLTYRTWNLILNGVRGGFLGWVFMLSSARESTVDCVSQWPGWLFNGNLHSLLNPLSSRDAWSMPECLLSVCLPTTERNAFSLAVKFSRKINT